MTTESNTLAGVFSLLLSYIAIQNSTNVSNNDNQLSTIKTLAKGQVETKENFPVLTGPVQTPKGLLGGGCFFCDPSRVSRRNRSLSAGAGFVPGRRGFVAWGHA